MVSPEAGLPLHVDYVAEGEGDVAEAIAYVLEVIGRPANATILAVTTLAVLAFVAGYLRVRPFRRDLAVLREALTEYRDLVPWLLRISLGMPLVGAGFAGYYFSPAVAVDARLLQVSLGFLLLFGLATRTVALAAVVAYLAAVPVYPRILLANEFVGGLLAVALLGGGRPSADHVLKRVADAPGTVYGRVDPVARFADRFQAWIRPYRRFLPTLVRATLGVAFLSLGVGEKLLQPGPALTVVAKYDLTAVVPVAPGLWVVGAGLAETAVGLALLAGLFTRATAGVAFTLFTLTLFALPDDPVLAHLSLYGLVSVLVITGGGPYSLDRRWFGTRDVPESDRGSPAPS